MADGISTSSITKVSNVTNLDPLKNYIIIDSDDRNLTGRVSFNDFIDLVARHIQTRQNMNR